MPPEKLHFTWDAISAAESSLNTGSLLYTEDYSLDLSGAVQLDWTEQQMEQQTETEYLLDAENIPRRGLKYRRTAVRRYFCSMAERINENRPEVLRFQGG